MTVLMSGINMYSMALVMKVVLGWDINFSIWISSITVAIYVALGGLRSAIFNEVLQFVLIWLGVLLIPDPRLERGGRLDRAPAADRANAWASTDYTHLWSTLGSFRDNPMGIHWTGIVLGLGLVISFGYWTTDFLVVQRVLTAKDLRSAKMAPIIGAGFKMMVPFIVILPGLLGLSSPSGEAGRGGSGRCFKRPQLQRSASAHARALLWTRPARARNHRPDRRIYVWHGRERHRFFHCLDLRYLSIAHPQGCALTSITSGWDAGARGLGVLVSIGTAYLVMQFLSIMDYVQALFSFFIAPLFGTVLLGMLWKRATPAGGFWGLLCGTLSSIAMWAWVKLVPGALSIIALSPNAKDMAENMYRALWSWLICVVVTVVVSLATRPLPEKQLVGLVYGCTEVPSEGATPLFQRPVFWAAIVAVVFVVLNILFW